MKSKLSNTHSYSPLNQIIIFCLLLFVCSCSETAKQKNGDSYSGKLYEYNENSKPQWSSFENINGEKGKGGMENNGAKGHPYDYINAGESKLLLDVRGSGIINRIWMTINDRSPEMLRSLKLEMFWDNEEKPAVAVPLGDFFGTGLGKTAIFHNTFFANPEGRSFNCFIPMPFRKAAKIKITNESGKKLNNLFFDVDFQLTEWKDSYMYFHTYWSRDTATTLAKDFELLPGVNGKGRFLGVNIGINANPLYKDSWWGEGEVKMYLDGDKEFPTIVGTGTEDYIGTAWGQGQFFNDYSGCLVADDKNIQWAYYRYHVPDPVFFEKECRVTIQQIGGSMKKDVLAMQKAKVPLIPVTIDSEKGFIPLYKKDSTVSLDDPSLPDGWTNFYRSDDVSATAYFYLNSPSSGLAALQPVGQRISNMQAKP